MKINKQLLNKYNVQVPRYTSYPPANHFTTEFSETDYKDLLVASNTEDPQLLAFYVHIPFCKQICYYCGCNAVKMRDEFSIEKYIEMIKKEIEIISGKINNTRKISQIHYGGGTPNAIEAKFLKEINELLFSKFKLIEKPEIAIECNPALLDYEYLDALFDAGFNRISLGIQDFNLEVLKGVNRAPSALPVKELVEYIKNKNSQVAVNLDFIYGLPGQSVDSFTDTIKKAIEIRPDRLVTFSYAHVPWMKKNQMILDKMGLPDGDEKMSMFLSAYKLMKEAGYISVGLDHYALPEDELSAALENHQLHRNFQGYCTKRTTGQVYAVGVSGISQLHGGYSQNIKDIKDYIKSLEEDKLPVEKGYVVIDEQKIIRAIINELMCNKTINWQKKSNEFNMSVEYLKELIGYNANTLSELSADELIEFNDDGLRITELGTIFIRNVVSVFDPALGKSGKQYSKSL